MAEPIGFISTHRVREGKLDGLEQLYRESAPLVEASKPDTVFFEAYLDEEGTEVKFIHVFPDADAMDVHVQGADERSAKAFEFIQPLRFEIFGTLSDGVLSMMRQAAEGTGVDVIDKPHSLGGFIRLPSG